MDIVCNNCGSVNDFRTEKKANNLVAYCLGCGRYIKNIPYSAPSLYFGKYKNTKIKDFTTPEMMNYLHWALYNCKLTGNVRDAIITHLGIKEV